MLPEERKKNRKAIMRNAAERANLQRERLQQKAEMEELRATLERERKKIEATPPPSPRPPPLRIRRPPRAQVEAAVVNEKPFPEHDHVWTIVEIENNPVAVMCKICDETKGLADNEPDRPTPEVSFAINGVYRIDVGGVNPVRVILQDVQMASKYNASVVIQAEFRSID